MRSLILCSALLASLSHADWEITAPSNVSFLSTKNSSITEVHRFNSVTGTLTEKGSATMVIDLTSVNTGIEIRDERMQKMLFDVDQFSKATLTTSVDPALLKKAQSGAITEADIPASLSLHGHEVSMPAKVIITPAKDGSIVVSSAQPVLLQASEFGLVEGINKLRDIAKLQHIATTVPVSFTLTFKAQ